MCPLKPIGYYHLALFIPLAIFYAFASPFFALHNDIGWHLATGDLIRATHAVPATDPWAYTSAGAPWYNLSWLWDVLASLVFSYSGMFGLAFFTTAIGLATVVLLAALSREMGTNANVTLGLCLVVGIVFPFYAPPDIFLCIAPQQVSLLCSAWLLWLLKRFCEQPTARYYFIVTLLFAAWCNLHGGFLLGNVAIALLAAAALLKGDMALARRSVGLLLLSLAAIFINPYGIHIIEGVRGTLGHPFQQDVSEWQPLLTHFTIFMIPALAYAVIFLMALPPSRAWRTPFSLALALLSVLLLIKGFQTLRYFSLFLLVSIPVTASGITQWRHSRDNVVLEYTRHAWAGLLGGAVLAFIILLSRVPPTHEMPAMRDPKAEIDYIARHYPQARLINHWNYGSFLIYETRGKLQPFIDGRLGTAYPPALFDDFKNLYQTKDWGAILKKYHATLVIWPRGDDEMLAWFNAHKQWRVAFTGNLAVVLVNESGQNRKRD